MKKTLALLTCVALVAFAYSCNKKTQMPANAKIAYLDLPATPYAYETNTWGDPLANYKATLGRVLFYDTRLSVNNAISCGSCHKQVMAFADNVALSPGFEGRLTKRNSIAINAVSLSGPLFWDGRESDVNKLSLKPITNHVEMGITNLNDLSEKLAGLEYYKPLFANAWGDEEVTAERIAASIGTFMSAMVPGMSRFDMYTRGNKDAMTGEEIEGMSLFDTKYNCAACHAGSGGYGGIMAFKDIGLDQQYTDMGLGALTGNPGDRGTFRVPNLANVALTAPYMHDGRYATLEDVIDHYSNNIQSSPNLDTLLKRDGGAMVMNISAREKKCMVAFLKTLTDYSITVDEKFANPFKTR